MEKNNKQISEGDVKIVLSENVFYNPKMKTLRDLSVLFVSYFNNEEMSLLDCTTATGVRGMRYIKEAKIKKVVFVDINKEVYETACKNLKINNIDQEIINTSIQEFCSKSNSDKFDFIDLDPFGSPQPYLNDIMKVAKDGTILMITATDTAVLCGAHSNACIKIYNSKPMHNELCKESGMRILISNVIKVAGTFNFGVDPILSISDMHYMRIFIRLKTGAKNALASIKEIGFVSFCKSCKSFSYKKGVVPLLKEKCDVCNNTIEVFGDFYLGKINNKKIIDDIINKNSKENIINNKKLDDILNLLSEELELPFFYSIPKITKMLKERSISPEYIKDRLKTLGFLSSRTQFDRDGIKTNANIKVIKKIIVDRV